MCFENPETRTRDSLYDLMFQLLLLPVSYLKGDPHYTHLVDKAKQGTCTCYPNLISK